MTMRLLSYFPKRREERIKHFEEEALGIINQTNGILTRDEIYSVIRGNKRPWTRRDRHAYSEFCDALQNMARDEQVVEHRTIDYPTGTGITIYGTPEQDRTNPLDTRYPLERLDGLGGIGVLDEMIVLSRPGRWTQLNLNV